jgi:urea transport system permease protein
VNILVLKLLSGFLISTICSSYVLASNLSQADLKNLFGEDFSLKQSTVAKVVDAPPEIASNIFFALQDENVFLTTDQLVVLKVKNAYVDAITNITVTVDEAKLESPTLNNSIRSDIEAAVSQYKLLSKDLLIRTQAMNTLSDDVSQIKPELIKKAYEIETDPHLKKQLASLDAMVSYATADATKKRELLKLLGNSSLLGAQNFLANLMKKDDSGNFVEKDKSLLPAIELALNEFKSRRFRAEVVSNIFTGLSLGSILLLAALGLAITYGLIGVINMAHGEFLMVGAYSTFIVQTIFRSFFMQYQDYYLIFAIPAAFVSAAVVGLILEFLVLRHLYGRPLETLLATFGVSLLMMQAVRVVFGAQNVEVGNPSWMSGSFSPLQDFFPGLLIPYNRLIIFFFAIAIVFMTWLVLNKTRMGLFVRAVTQNRSMASCVGVKTRRVDSYAFAFGAGIAGLGGCALSQIGNVGPDLGQSYIIDSFMAVVLGGVGQLAGTIIGSFGLGILSKFSEPFMGAVLTKIGLLVMIILFIQKRPQGMFALKGRSAEN